jgi:uncharacterized protein (TIGR02466 family)
MNLINIFSSIVAIENLDINNQEMIDHALYLKSKSKGVTASNREGWQSERFDLNQKQFQLLFSKINEMAQSIHNQIGLKKNLQNKLSAAWLNINNLSGFNVPHIHLGASLSGTYYLKGVESGANGNIVFRNPWIVDYHMPDYYIEELTNITSGAYPVLPEAGKLIIFPSWLEHYVEPNTANVDRISLSFDTRII